MRGRGFAGGRSGREGPAASACARTVPQQQGDRSAGIQGRAEVSESRHRLSNKEREHFMNRRKLALLCASMFVLAGLGSAFAASSASAMTIIIRSKLGPIRDEIIIGKLPSETTRALATGGNTFQGVSKSGVPCHSE